MFVSCGRRAESNVTPESPINNSAVPAHDSPIKHDVSVKVTSHLGNSFVIPSKWAVEDKGDTYSIRSPDGRAVIYAIMFSADGSGSMDHFRQTMTSGLLPKGVSAWEPSEWTEVKIGEDMAHKRSLAPVPASNQEWRLYALSTGKFYYAVVLTATPDAMFLNGAFYEEIVLSFRGVR
jgi:hypothetical protein